MGTQLPTKNGDTAPNFRPISVVAKRMMDQDAAWYGGRPRPTSVLIPSDILIHAAIWPQQIWAENWGLCPFKGGGAGSPPNTMWPGPRPTCMSSFILIRPTVWPQCTNVTDRTGQTDNGPIAQGEPFYKRSPKNVILTAITWPGCQC